MNSFSGHNPNIDNNLESFVAGDFGGNNSNLADIVTAMGDLAQADLFTQTILNQIAPPANFQQTIFNMLDNSSEPSFFLQGQERRHQELQMILPDGVSMHQLPAIIDAQLQMLQQQQQQQGNEEENNAVGSIDAVVSTGHSQVAQGRRQQPTEEVLTTITLAIIIITVVAADNAMINSTIRSNWWIVMLSLLRLL
jgi:hypothetical protein